LTLSAIIITHDDVCPEISKISEKRQASATTNPGDHQLKTVVIIIIIIICKKMVAIRCSHNKHFTADNKACKHYFYMLELKHSITRWHGSARVF